MSTASGVFSWCRGKSRKGKASPSRWSSATHEPVASTASVRSKALNKRDTHHQTSQQQVLDCRSKALLKTVISSSRASATYCEWTQTCQGENPTCRPLQLAQRKCPRVLHPRNRRPARRRRVSVWKTCRSLNRWLRDWYVVTSNSSQPLS